MRIDLVITELEVGGAERCCFELAHFLHRRSHNVRILSIGPFAKPPKDELLRKTRSVGIPILSFHAARSIHFPWAWWRLRRAVRRSRPDVVQSFLWHANVLSASVYPSLGIPLFGGNRVLEPRTQRHRWSRWAAKKMKKVVCVSQSVAEWTHRVEGIPLEKIAVVPNGIDLDAWDRLATHPVATPSIDPVFETDVPLLLFVGRLHEQKGIDILISRMNEILESLPQHQLVIVGDGPSASKLRVAREASPHRARICTLGQREDISRWMHRSSLLLLPTRYEGMPNVLLEAMASGIAVATMNVEGVAELLADRLEEQSVPRDDWEAWVQRVVSNASNAIRSQELGRWNRHRVEQAFQLSDQLKKYEDMYLETARLKPFPELS